MPNSHPAPADKRPASAEKHPAPADKQHDDLTRAEQNSHGDQQKRSKKDGHTAQIGTGSDQGSSRNRGEGARRP